MRQPQRSLWLGPTRDGVTQSLLQKFIVCRERFRLKVVEGWTEPQTFTKMLPIEYGNMFHDCLETYHAGRCSPKITDKHFKKLKKIQKRLNRQYPDSTNEIAKWVQICKYQFPVYAAKWSNEDKHRNFLLQEETFQVDYTLPSKRTVKLRGKWDGVFSERVKGTTVVYLQENKTKGRIDEDGLVDQLSEDLQVMFYIIALQERYNNVIGCLYNVIKRPLAPYSKHCIKQKKTETEEAFLTRLHDEHFVVATDDFFKRWQVYVSQDDIDRFKKEVLHPLLESLVDWWESIEHDPFNPWEITQIATAETSLRNAGRPVKVPNPHHFRRPFGVYDNLALGQRGDYYDIITRGDTFPYEKAETLYPELD